MVHYVAHHLAQGFCRLCQIPQGLFALGFRQVFFLCQFAHADDGGQRRAHVVAQMPHKRAFHTAGFFCQPAPVCEVERDAADGKNARYGKQAVEQAHVVQLPVEAFLKCRCILAHTYAAQHFAHLSAHMATQAALLRHKHAEQAQALPAALLWRCKHFRGFIGTARKGRAFPHVCHVFWPQGRAADDAYAHPFTRAALCQLPAHVGRVYQHQRAAILRGDCAL